MKNHSQILPALPINLNSSLWARNGPLYVQTKRVLNVEDASVCFYHSPDFTLHHSLDFALPYSAGGRKSHGEGRITRTMGKRAVRGARTTSVDHPHDDDPSAQRPAT